MSNNLTQVKMGAVISLIDRALKLVSQEYINNELIFMMDIFIGG